MATEKRPHEEVAAAADEVRWEKIERLRAAIADGTYAVSAEALADKMLKQGEGAEE